MTIVHAMVRTMDDVVRGRVFGIGAGVLTFDEFLVAMLGIVGLMVVGVAVTHVLFALLDLIAPERR